VGEADLPVAAVAEGGIAQCGVCGDRERQGGGKGKKRLHGLSSPSLGCTESDAPHADFIPSPP
jgi:hypothetical protein